MDTLVGTHMSWDMGVLAPAAILLLVVPLICQLVLCVRVGAV